VVVVGISNEAIEEAQVLTKFASTVHWVTLRSDSDEWTRQELLAHPSVKLWSKARIQAIKGNSSGVTAVELLLMGQRQPNS